VTAPPGREKEWGGPPSPGGPLRVVGGAQKTRLGPIGLAQLPALLANWLGTHPVTCALVSRTRIGRKFGSTVSNYEMWEPSHLISQ